MAAVTTAVLPTSWPSWRLYIVVFVASACSLVLEIAAGRLLAPEIGVSLYTWTSIIGVVLAGISLGNYLGGRLADRFPAPSTLGLALLAGSLTSFGVLALLPILIDTLRYLPLVPRVLATNVGLFFLPSCLLGMVTPLAIKQALTDLRTAGGIVGRLYAISTAGSILGVYLTGFVLVAMLGARTVVLLVGIVLLMLALLFGRLRQSIALTVILLVPTLVVVGHTLRGHHGARRIEHDEAKPDQDKDRQQQPHIPAALFSLFELRAASDLLCEASKNINAHKTFRPPCLLSNS